MTEAQAKTKLRLVEVITSPERSQLLRETLDDFEQIHQDIEVEVISIPWEDSLSKVILMTNSNDAPDVLEMPDRWLALFSGGEILLNIEDRLKNWPHSKTLEPKPMNFIYKPDGAYTVPYGLYLRAMFYNKTLLKQAGIEKPPHTMEELMQASKAISKIPGKWGYCLRGGIGSLNSWFMMATAMGGTNNFFTSEGKSKINEPNFVKGIQFLIDIYQKGYAPKESIDWGYNEIVSNFSKGRCAFLDQDPDAINPILKNMDINDFGVIPMPVGPAGRSFPTIGFAGWSISKSSKHPEESWKLLSFLLKPKQNLKWVKKIGIISIHQDTNNADHLKNELFSGWYQELQKDTYHPTVMPLYLEQFGNFENSIALFSSREALLGQRTAQELADLWANVLTTEFEKWEKSNNVKSKTHSYSSDMTPQ